MKYLLLLALIFFTGCQKNIETTPEVSGDARSSIKVYEDDRALNIIRNYDKYKSEKRTALVIGNGKYPDEFSLKNPINDSRAMKKVLEKVGFEIIYGENLTREQFSKILAKFQQRLKKNGGVGLFYYAGHGIESDGINYLIPIDARMDVDVIKFDSISLNEVLQRMNLADIRLKIIVLDACRNDPTQPGRKVFLEGFTSPPQAEGTFIAYATSAGSTASDGKGDHGLFTQYLLKYVSVKGLDLNEVFKKTRMAVVEETNKKQFPAVYDQTNGYFYFILPDLKDLKRRDDSQAKVEILDLETNQEKEDSKITIKESSSEFAKLQIFVYPENAQILINGKKYNPEKQYRKGKYKINISAKGYETKQFELNLDKSKTVEVTLKRNWFRLTVVPNPLDSKIEILDYKGKYHKGILLKRNKYQLKISAKNHKTKIVEINLQKDLIVKVKLEQTKFRLQINTIPEDAKIEFSSGVKYYDGIYLNRGNYQIKVFAEGFKTKNINLTLKNDTTLNIDLTKAKNDFETIYSWTGEKIIDFNFSEYKYPKATFQEFLSQVEKYYLAPIYKNKFSYPEFIFNKRLEPQGEFEPTAKYEERKSAFYTELETKKAEYNNAKNQAYQEFINKRNQQILEVKNNLAKQKNQLFCYWFNLGQTQNLDLKYNPDLEYFVTTIWIKHIPIKFNFPVPLDKAEDFKKETKFINLDFGIKKNNIFIVEAFATFGSIFQDKFQTKLNINFSFEKSKKELEKITGKSWNELQKVTELNLKNYQGERLPNAINRLKNLKYLYIKPTLKLDNLSENIKQAIFNTDKKELEKITGKTWKELQKITKLNLSSKGLTKLPISIGGLKNLSSLSLSGNENLDFDDAFKKLSKLKNLSSLSLCWNGLERLPESIGGLKNLSSLNLNSNKLERLPESIGELKNLSSLSLESNELERLPESIGELKNLSSLDLSENGLERLPETIGELKNLSSLYLIENELERLPESIKKLASTLKELVLGDNPVWYNQEEMRKIKSWLPYTRIVKWR